MDVDIIYVNTFLHPFEKEITVKIKEFLENKHLYQGYEIKLPDFEELFACNEAQLKQQGVMTSQKLFLENQIYPALCNFLWHLYQEDAEEPTSTKPQKLTVVNFSLNINAPKKLNLYCKRCKKIEPFICIDARELTGEDWHIQFEDKTREQLFVLAYQCQNCTQKSPEVFLLYRKGLKVCLNGRHPMEGYPEPTLSYIPKNQLCFYEDAQIAYGSGQALPAIFLLRTLIEQFIRDQASNEERTSSDLDGLMDKYYSDLPNEFTDYYPSLRDIYKRLSVDIHAANASDIDFEKSLDEINRFFIGLNSFMKEYSKIVKKKSSQK